MNDSEWRPHSIDEVWDRVLAAARVCWEDVEKDDYFLGLFDAHMADLAELASLTGRLHEYVAICREFDGISWTFREG